jgi:hypothetical protein
VTLTVPQDGYQEQTEHQGRQAGSLQVQAYCRQAHTSLRVRYKLLGRQSPGTGSLSSGTYQPEGQVQI